MKRIHPYLFSAILALSAHVTLGKINLVDLVGNDAWVVVEADLARLEKDFQESPFHEQAEKFFKQATEAFWKGTEDSENPSQEDLQEFFGLIEKISGKFNGQAVGAFGLDLIQTIQDVQAGEEPDMDILFLAKTEGTYDELADFAKWAGKQGEDAPEFTEEEIEGVPVLFFNDSLLVDGLLSNFDNLGIEEGVDIPLESDADEDGEIPTTRSIGFFVHKGIFGACLGQQKIKELLQHIEEGSHADPARGKFEANFEDIGQGDANIYMETAFLGDLVEFLAENKATQIPENPVKVTTQGLLKALALEELQAMAMSIDFTPEGAELGSAAYIREMRGIWKFLDLYQPGKPLPKFVPDGIFYTSTAGYGLNEIWPTFEGLLMDMSPVIKGMLDFQMQVLDKTHKTNIKEDLLTNLGDQMTSFSRYPEFSSDDDKDMVAARDVYVLGLDDSKAFSRTLDQILETVMKDKLKTRTHKGVDVRFTHLLGNTYISYAVTQQKLVVSMGKPSDLNQVLDHLSDPPGKTLWSDPAVDAIVQDSPQGIVQWDYVDLEGLPEFMNETMMEVIEEGFPEGLFEEGFPPLPFQALSWTKRIQGGIISKSTLVPKE